MLNQQDAQWDFFVGGQWSYIYEDNVFAGLAPASGKDFQSLWPQELFWEEVQKISRFGQPETENFMLDTNITRNVTSGRGNESFFDISNHGLGQQAAVLQETEIKSPIEVESKPLEELKDEEARIGNIEESETSRNDFYDTSLMTDKCDFKLRDSLRYLRKFLLHLYKKENKKIIQKRYANWTLEEISRSVRQTFSKLLSHELVTSELVSYLTGILALKTPDELECSMEVQIEITDFLSTVRKFSFRKFKKVMMSRSAQILWRCLIQESEDSKVVRLKNALNMQ